MHGRHHDDCCVTIVSASYGCLCGKVKDHPDASDNDWRARLNGVNCERGNESANRGDRYGKVYASASDQREHANGHVPNMIVRKAVRTKGQITHMVMVMVPPHGKHTKEVHAESKGADK